MLTLHMANEGSHLMAANLWLAFDAHVAIIVSTVRIDNSIGTSVSHLLLVIGFYKTAVTDGSK